MNRTPDTLPPDWISQLRVRLLRQEDLPALEWDGEFTHFRRVYADAYERYLRGYSLMWVAEHPLTGLIGQVFIQLICDRPELADGVERAYFYSFRVRTPFRGCGVGSCIMDVVEDDIHCRGYKIMTLNVARINSRAIQLYQRRGYIITSPEPGIWRYQDEIGIWHTVEEPAWRMEKLLV